MRESRGGKLLWIIGGTPMVDLGFPEGRGCAQIAAKLEFFNPGGSIKDRAAKNMIFSAEESGEISPGDTIVEPTSGNTGIGLALVAAVRGYGCRIFMPEGMSPERGTVMKALGAEVILTPESEGMSGAIDRALEESEKPGCWMPNQFKNPANPDAHRKDTGPEILRQTGRRIGAFVAGIGTGGTIMGVSDVLRRRIPEVRIYGVEPAESAVISGGEPGKHAIQGIGAGFVPPLLDIDILDGVIPISGEEAMENTRRLAAEFGLFAGISSGAAFAASRRIAREYPDISPVVTIFPDGGGRYLSSGVFGE